MPVQEYTYHSTYKKINAGCARIFLRNISSASLPGANSFTYFNINSEETRIKIRRDLKNKAGVYCIKHMASNKVYIGSSHDLTVRLLDHINNRSSNIHLQRAIAKYGISNFSISILEIIPRKDVTDPLYDLAARLVEAEQSYFSQYVDKYNINPIAGKTRLGAKHTLETKALFSKLRRSNPTFLNMKHSKAYVDKIRARMSGKNNPMFGTSITDKNKKLISEMFSKKIYMYEYDNIDKGPIRVFDKQTDLLKEMAMSSKTLIKYKDSGLLFRSKYLFYSSPL